MEVQLVKRWLSIRVLIIPITILSFGCTNPTVTPTLSSLDEQLTSAIENSSSGIGNSYYVLPDANDLKAIPQDPKNILTKEKIDLGKLLFHETGLANNPLQAESLLTYSCASCHHARAGFQAGLRQGIGEGGLGFGSAGEGRVNSLTYFREVVDAQTIRTPTVMNSAYQTNMLWNGMLGATGVNVGTEEFWTLNTPKDDNFLGFEGLETQAIAGLKVHRMIVIDDIILDNPEYISMFDAAFPGEQISKINAGLAIAAYERSIMSNEAPFQNWLRGETTAMSFAEKEGAILFFSKANCFTCHNGPALNSMNFYALGMNDLEGPFVLGFDTHNDSKSGRGGFTERGEDMNKFKVPQLYNLTDSPFLGHGGNFKTVQEILEYKNRAVVQNQSVNLNNIAKEFIPLELTNEEIMQITAFIVNSLNDPNLMRYEPASVPTGLCFPNNDSQSKIDLGCD